MDPRKPPEHVIDVFADPASVKDVLKDLTLPAVGDVEVEALIDSRIDTLIRQHLSQASSSPYGGVRGRIAVQFFEK
ncbi:hypothetical protein CIHG_08471 [Coccidioides immitis H538.4]|uniref:Uncharacterized protein n=1 Tax=Coccidioides immitis H538.4 TaxID=396776 RepID=A0A0J8RZS4_COCIT|nr:hypothetical protein CIHG_08471 [Coccidioides immitis H538.4]